MAGEELPIPVRFPSQESANDFIHRLVQSETEDTPPNATSKSFIKTLKTVKTTEDLLKALNPTSSWSCPICMEEFKLDQKLVKVPRRHWFHRDCVLKWLGRNNTCPMCRKEFPKQHKYLDSGLIIPNGVSIIINGSSRLTYVRVRQENDAHYVTVRTRLVYN